MRPLTPARTRHALLAVSIVLIVVSAFLIALTACSSPPAPAVTGGAVAATASPASPAAPEPSCGWYTPMTGAAYGQAVTVTARGPACRTRALVRWIAVASDLPWASASAAPGTLIAQLARGGTTVQIWQDGFAGATDATAGGLADRFELAGWAVQRPACPPSGCGPTPDITYTTYPSGAPVP
jgi:hypothetical protein